MADGRKPNILILWGDDIGWWNISHNSRGQMGYRTPNIDRVANEGAVLHRLLRAAKLHGRPRRIYYRAKPHPYRSDQSRYAGSGRRHQREGSDDRRDS